MEIHYWYFFKCIYTGFLGKVFVAADFISSCPLTISILVMIFAYMICNFKRKKIALPPYNPDNMTNTLRIFTGTKSPEYVLKCWRSLGNVFMCK